MDYSTKIRKIKEQFYLDDIQFADVLGVSVIEVRDWQNGIEKPNKEGFKKLYDVFGISCAMLLDSKKRCVVYAMRIRLNKNFQLMDVFHNYYGRWKVCALRKRPDLYILNPIVSFLRFIIAPFETIGDAAIDGVVESIKSGRNYIDYTDYLLEYEGKAILVNYKNGNAFVQSLPNISQKRKFKFNGRIYKKVGYMV